MIPLMKRKMELSTFIFELSSPAGFHAQYLWRDLFIDLGYSIEAEDTNEFKGRKASIGGDIDFIAKKDGIFFGVEVKNSLEYPNDLGKKVQIAIELGTLPVMIVRRVTWEVYQNLKKYGVLTKIYETSIFPQTYEQVIVQCKETLGLPVIALDKITEKRENT